MAKAKKETAPKKSSNQKKRLRKATTRSTAGPGYQFEDLVAAWLMVKMLRGEVIPGISVPGNKLQMQTSALGWEIDDLLVYGEPSIDGEVARLAISCKSNVQVTAAGLPATFVSTAWKQWQKPALMDHHRDVIALVPRDRHTGFAAVWADIKSWCADSDVDFALAKINETNYQDWDGAPIKHRHCSISTFIEQTQPSLTRRQQAPREVVVGIPRKGH